MQVIQAQYAKNKFGEVIHSAQHEEIIVERYGTQVAAIISVQQLNKFKNMENDLLTIQAEMAKKEGFIGQKESENLLAQLLDA